MYVYICPFKNVSFGNNFKTANIKTVQGTYAHTIYPGSSIANI